MSDDEVMTPEEIDAWSAPAPAWWQPRTSVARKVERGQRVPMGHRIFVEGPRGNPDGTVTLDEAWRTCLTQGVDPRQVRVTGLLYWVADATDEEQARVEQAWADHDERHARWERETYQRLRAKFEGVGE